MKGKGCICCNIKMAFAMFTTPTFTRRKEIGFVADVYKRQVYLHSIIAKPKWVAKLLKSILN